MNLVAIVALAVSEDRFVDVNAYTCSAGTSQREERLSNAAADIQNRLIGIQEGWKSMPRVGGIPSDAELRQVMLNSRVLGLREHGYAPQVTRLD
jgi:hypothetical protein